MFSHTGATHTVDFKNAINLRSAAGNATERVIEVANGSGKVDARISGVIANGVGTASLKKTGAGTLELTANNTYSGLTTVSAGTLLVNGSLSSTLGVHVESGATLGGRGAVAKVSGAGTLSVGNSAGIFTTGQLDTSEGMDFRFELTAATVGGVSLPNFADASNSGNDVLRLTGATPFTQTLDANNTITLDFTGSGAAYGDLFVGGFFATTDFFDDIKNANFVWIGLSGDLYVRAISTIEQTADFAGGSATGYITQFEVVPEPSSTLFVLMGGAAGWMAFSRRRKMSKAA
jgi:autotransporter-associated beta strand protein